MAALSPVDSFRVEEGRDNGRNGNGEEDTNAARHGFEYLYGDQLSIEDEG